MAIEEDKAEGCTQSSLKASQTAEKLLASAVIVDMDETPKPVLCGERGLGKNEVIHGDVMADPTDWYYAARLKVGPPALRRDTVYTRTHILIDTTHYVRLAQANAVTTGQEPLLRSQS
jgi:hypothetical protein